jgi:hypothetical protein
LTPPPGARCLHTGRQIDVLLVALQDAEVTHTSILCLRALPFLITWKIVWRVA